MLAEVVKGKSYTILCLYNTLWRCEVQHKIACNRGGAEVRGGVLVCQLQEHSWYDVTIGGGYTILR